jgi:hypothetical protein
MQKIHINPSVRSRTSANVAKMDKSTEQPAAVRKPTNSSVLSRPFSNCWQEPKPSASSIRMPRRCPLITTGVICSSPEAVAGYLEFARIEAQAILGDHQHIVFALAKALKVYRSLGATEIDEVIGDAVDQKALADERARRAAWRQVTERVAEITS